MTTTVQTRARKDITTPTLSALEWKVVSLAMREAGEAGSNARSWFGRLLDRGVGVRPKLPLADPRLETLRRFVARMVARADVSELKPALIELGFHPKQISAVTMLVR